MNPLQTGTPASQLTSPGYRNSSQKSDYQSTLNTSDFQRSSDAILRTPATGKLQVLGVPSDSVLGESITIQGASYSGGGSGLLILIIAAAALASVFFFVRFRKQAKNEIKDEENEESFED